MQYQVIPPDANFPYGEGNKYTVREVKRKPMTWGDHYNTRPKALAAAALKEINRPPEGCTGQRGRNGARSGR